MSLDTLVNTLLKPFRWTDEQILRQYTKVAVWAEEKKNINRYKIAFSLNCISLANSFASLITNDSSGVKQITFSEQPITYTTAFILGNTLGLLYVHDTVYNCHQMLKKNMNLSNEKAIDQFEYYSTRIQRAARLPITALFFSCGLLIYEGVSRKDYHMISTGIDGGVYLFCLASSMYIKDSNPKLLDKAKNVLTETLSQKSEDVKIPVRY